MEASRMPVGIEFFERLRRSGCYYVDKSEMIMHAAGNGNMGVTLFTRPRRFGKTLTMSMLQSFFDITRDSRDVFEGLAITKHEDFCKEWMNQYPVLFLSLKDVEGYDYKKAYGRLKGRIANLCKEHSCLLQSEKVDADDRAVFQKLKSETADELQVEDSLLTLTRMLYAHYGKPAVVLIDEYDVPLSKAYDANMQPDHYLKMLSTIRSFLGGALKTNPYLQFAVLTGCMRISKESIFTGVNNFKSYSILDSKFSDAFGFTQEEVSRLLCVVGLSKKLTLVKSWYDGYIFGDSEIFCPWDVLNYVNDYVSLAEEGCEREPGNYWKNSSGNSIVDEFVKDERFDVSEKFETLMNGGCIEQAITDQLTYEELKEEEDNFWSVLFMTGYLTKADKNERGGVIHLKIPNAEISSIFEDSIVRRFKKSIDRDVQREVMQALWEKDERKASRLLSELLWNTISYHDYHENYYHAFVTGLVAGCGYEVDSNQENGLGRTDILIRDRKNRRAVIIEAKKAAKEGDLEKMCLEGKRQIIERKYIKGLKGYTQVICYGMSFFEKTAMARLLDMEEAETKEGSKRA